jgi:hypothetical protein
MIRYVAISAIRCRPMKIIFSLSMAAAACAVNCAQAAARSGTPCSADFVTTGVYRNVNFGFTMTIPRGLKATWSSTPCSFDTSTNDCVCMNDHGRAIALAGGGTISIYADHNAMGWSLPTIAFEGLNDFKSTEPGGELGVMQLDRLKWKAMPAYHYVVRNEGKGEAIVRESVVASTGHGDDMVVLYIEASEKQYNKYRAAFNVMLRSWRASPIL